MGRQGRLGAVAESQAGQLRIVEVERGGGGSAIEKTGVGLGLATREVRVACLALELGKLNNFQVVQGTTREYGCAAL